MSYERADPRFDVLDARLRDLPGSSLHSIVSAVSEIDAFRGWWDGRFAPPPPFLAGFRERAVAAAGAASSRITWSGLPAPARGEGPVRPEALRLAQERYGTTLRAVFERHGEMAPTGETVFSLVAGIRGSGARAGGASAGYRASPDPPIVYPRRGSDAAILRSAEPGEIAGAMDSLLRWAGARLEAGPFHPLLAVAGFVLELLAIRPFPDGNARLSRLLTQLLLLRSGYGYLAYSSLDRAISDQKAEYYIALRKAQATLALPRTDTSPWMRGFLAPMRAQVRELRFALSGVPPESRLSANQQAVFRLLDRHGDVAVRLVVGELGIPRETAKQVLSRLLRLGAVVRSGAGRAARYRIAGDSGRLGPS